MIVELYSGGLTDLKISTLLIFLGLAVMQASTAMCISNTGQVSQDSVHSNVVKGRVVNDSTGMPVPFALITLVLNCQAVQSTYSDSDGLFQLPLVLPGRYSIRSTAVNYNSTILQLSGSSEKSIDLLIRLTPVSNYQLPFDNRFKLYCLDSSMVAGYVYGHYNRNITVKKLPLESSVISFKDSTGRVRGSAYTDSTGLYRLKLPVGTYSLEVISLDFRMIVIKEIRVIGGTWNFIKDIELRQRQELED